MNLQWLQIPVVVSYILHQSKLSLLKYFENSEKNTQTPDPKSQYEKQQCYK